MTPGYGFSEAWEKEVKQGWIGPAVKYPPSIPFRVKSGSVEPKGDGTARLVWNASWPIVGAYASMVKMGTKNWMPMSTNANTELPPELDYEWTAIEAISETIAILADAARQAGTVVYGRTYDLRKWFRQLTVRDSELWI